MINFRVRGVTGEANGTVQSENITTLQLLIGCFPSIQTPCAQKTDSAVVIDKYFP